jgi:hypothetical protein
MTTTMSQRFLGGRCDKATKPILEPSSMQILIPTADATSLHSQKRSHNKVPKHLRRIISNGSTRYRAKVCGAQLTTDDALI